MAQISVSNLTFCYEGSFDNIFEEVSFVLDSDWKLGLWEETEREAYEVLAK